MAWHASPHCPCLAHVQTITRRLQGTKQRKRKSFYVQFTSTQLSLATPSLYPNTCIYMILQLSLDNWSLQFVVRSTKPPDCRQPAWPTRLPAEFLLEGPVVVQFPTCSTNRICIYFSDCLPRLISKMTWEITLLYDCCVYFSKILTMVVKFNVHMCLNLCHEHQ